jgi:hypothetical protein
LLIRIEVTRGGFPRELPVVTRTGACAAPRCATRAESPYIRNVLSSVTCRFAPVSHFVSRSPIGTRLLGCTHSTAPYGTAAASPHPGAGSARRGSRFNVRSDQRLAADATETRGPDARGHRDRTSQTQRHCCRRATRHPGGGAHMLTHMPRRRRRGPPAAPRAAPGAPGGIGPQRPSPSLSSLARSAAAARLWAVAALQRDALGAAQSPTGTCKHTLVGQIQVGWPGDRDYHTQAVTRSVTCEEQLVRSTGTRDRSSAVVVGRCVKMDFSCL